MTFSAKTKKAFVWFAATVLLLLVGVLVYNIIEKEVYPIEYGEYVEKYAAEFDVEEELVYAVIKTESSFDPQAISDVGAIGLMQIMPDTFKWLQAKHKDKPKQKADVLYDPETNIKYGTFFLSLLKKEFGSDRLTIAAYHAGRGKVNRWLSDAEISPDGKNIKNIPSKSTGHYVDKVMGNMEKYKKLMDSEGNE